MGNSLARFTAHASRASSRAGGRPRSLRGRLVTVSVCLLAGFMITVSALNARGTDLRSDRTASMRELVAAQAGRNEELRQSADELRAEVEDLTARMDGGKDLTDALRLAGLEASTEPVAGPGVRVTLDDAPLEVKPAGVDDDALVVHQQDIQAVVNALWAGGAEAMTIQGQRVVATTGIKCVGNSVVLHGVPYAPPYVIEAIGDADSMERSLDDSDAVRIYQQYVVAYGLGYSFEVDESLEAPAFSGAIGVRQAQRTR
ncbi:DUF881 domain-containing protein [Tessaracoccus antarcticus]|uniref:DUF881 domain-containing protein n=1 Tax=Tessaracoccus antarcticus TaxID=2479848 RepID=A0A3M0GWI7_9ACTN|nr:DUF881 domain-containing protein [Tessaracoccus antarcticus]RMB61716.1 DUF881 domain-containing protein [Tessaracoccus antarcticus]